MAAVKIIGVHPIDAPEPCHLCEVEIRGEPEAVDFAEFTQPVAGQDRSNWQVAYDERLLSKGAHTSLYVFFFHYLDLLEPLQSPFGLLDLPQETALPERLRSVTYEPP
jgi:hypothetical protein